MKYMEFIVIIKYLMQVLHLLMVKMKKKELKK